KAPLGEPTLGRRRNFFHSRVWEIVVEDHTKTRSTFRHVARAELAETNAMSLTDTLKSYFPVLLARRKVVAGHCIPAEPSSDVEAPVFSMEQEACSIFRGDFPCPSNGVLVTKFAGHGKIGIARLWQADLTRGTGVAATASCKHCRDGFFIVGEHETVRRRRGAGCRAVGGRFAEKLAMGKVTEIEINVPPSSRD